MSLFHCPECNHEVSEAAAVCPSCGRPLKPEPVVTDKTRITPVTYTRRDRDGLPPWAIPLMIIGGLLIVVAIFLIFRGGMDEGNVDVSVNANRRVETVRDTRPPVDVPSSSQPASVPGSDAPPLSSTTVPGGSAGAPVPPPDKGAVAINAKILNSRGEAQPARNARFYLLEKDLETVLREARVTPIEGNTLTASLGLATVNPSRFAEFQRAAMRALSESAKYSGSTDTAGSANLEGVDPRQYYLFCITRVGNGFALWNSPITVQAGDNLLDLSPATVTEIPEG